MGLKGRSEIVCKIVWIILFLEYFMVFPIKPTLKISDIGLCECAVNELGLYL